MGHIDIENLHKIYQACNEFSKICNLPFQFKEDSGNKETMIGISEYGQVERPATEHVWRDPAKVGVWKMFVPDIMDYHSKIIIEFEETPGKPRPGAKLAKKGHDPDGNDRRTSWRDLYYEIGKFRLLKIFDFEFKDETLWKLKLFRFLADCYQYKPEVIA